MWADSKFVDTGQNNDPNKRYRQKNDYIFELFRFSIFFQA
jgi:hypothetical protein